MENNRRCEVCNVDVQRASMEKHIRIKKTLRQKDIVVPEWLFKEKQLPIKNKIKKNIKP